VLGARVDFLAGLFLLFLSFAMFESNHPVSRTGTRTAREQVSSMERVSTKEKEKYREEPGAPQGQTYPSATSARQKATSTTKKRMLLVFMMRRV
jgi:hypothetical protein